MKSESVDKGLVWNWAKFKWYETWWDGEQRTKNK